MIRPKSIGGIDIDILSIGKMMINTGIGFYFSRMRSKGSRSGGLGVEGVFAQRCPTVRAIPVWQVLQKGSLLEVSHVALLRFAWQALHFVTFRRVL